MINIRKPIDIDDISEKQKMEEYILHRGTKKTKRYFIIYIHDYKLSGFMNQRMKYNLLGFGCTHRYILL